MHADWNVRAVMLSIEESGPTDSGIDGDAQCLKGVGRRCDNHNRPRNCASNCDVFCKFVSELKD
jgi:hypothetical protein